MLGRLQRVLENARPSFPERLWRIALGCVAASVIVVPGAVWLGLRIPTIPLLNGMAIQSKLTTQSECNLFADGVGSRLPTDGALARGVSAYPYHGHPDAAGASLINPARATMENLLRGEQQYDIYCQPCHGYKGLADGSAVGAGRMPAPNTLHSDKVRQWTDGHIFHVITEGQNTMPSYAKQISALDRWAIVNYVRVLDRALNPRPEDFPASATVARGDANGAMAADAAVGARNGLTAGDRR